MCQAAVEVSKTFDWSVIKRIWLEEFQKATAL
jgi:hypothetical protein